MFNIKLMQSVNFANKKLYCLGNTELLKNNCVAVIGTRQLSRQGMRFGKEVTTRICNDGFTIVSGLALGSDTVAHKTALANQSPQIAVLPSGFNNIAPRSNIKIANEILEQGGLLVSEYEPQTPANRQSYLQRNQIVAQIANMVVVLECSRQSGTMNTVRHAYKLNKQLLAYLPDNPSAQFKTDGAKAIIENYNGLQMTR